MHEPGRKEFPYSIPNPSSRSLKEIQNEKAAVERWFKEITYNKETGGFIILVLLTKKRVLWYSKSAILGL